MQILYKAKCLQTFWTGHVSCSLIFICMRAILSTRFILLFVQVVFKKLLCGYWTAFRGEWERFASFFYCVSYCVSLGIGWFNPFWFASGPVRWPHRIISRGIDAYILHLKYLIELALEMNTDLFDVLIGRFSYQLRSFRYVVCLNWSKYL